LIAGCAVAASAGLAGVTPASASTSAFFTLSGGSISISEPSATGGVDLGTVAAGTLVLSHSLGAVTVSDTRGALVATWTSTVSSTDFVVTTAGSTPAANEKVGVANIAYVAGAATSQSGGVFAGGAVASMALPDISRVAGTFVGTGVGSATWNPTLTFTLLSSQVAGKYTGQITHSAA